MFSGPGRCQEETIQNCGCQRGPGGSFANQGYLTMSADIFGCPGGGGGQAATGIEWEEARAASQHPTIHRSALTARSY